MSGMFSGLSFDKIFVFLDCDAHSLCWKACYCSGSCFAYFSVRTVANSVVIAFSQSVLTFFLEYSLPGTLWVPISAIPSAPLQLLLLALYLCRVLVYLHCLPLIWFSSLLLLRQNASVVCSVSPHSPRLTGCLVSQVPWHIFLALRIRNFSQDSFTGSVCSAYRVPH